MNTSWFEVVNPHQVFNIIERVIDARSMESTESEMARKEFVEMWMDEKNITWELPQLGEGGMISREDVIIVHTQESKPYLCVSTREGNEQVLIAVEEINTKLLGVLVQMNVRRK